MISIGPKLGQHLMRPMTPVVTPPDFSVEDPVCVGSGWAISGGITLSLSHDAATKPAR
jgi:hypothetical protein